MQFIPLLAFVVVVYNILAFVSGGLLDATLWTMKLVSGASWVFTVNHLLLLVALILLFVEIIKSTRTSVAVAIDHMLSMLVFVVCLVEFIVVPQTGNSIFFLIMIITLLDVVAGFTVTISSARRDISVGNG